MKTVRIIIKSITVFLTLLTIAVFASLIYVTNSVSNYYLINVGETLEIDSLVPVRASYCADNVLRDEKADGDTVKMDIKVLGVIPAKQIDVKFVDDNYVAVLGTPFGIKIYTEGVLVVGFGDVDTDAKDKNPAKTAGLKEGDFIVSLNGVNVYTNEDVAEIIKNSNGERIIARIIRNSKSMVISFFPAKSKSSGIYRAGLWVKDSSAGIGTMTFYSPKYNVVAGLGHGICESETGTLLTLNSGEFVTADIVSYTKGKSGKAGELSGSFSGKKIAKFSKNTDYGVYGNVLCDISLESMFKVALKQEVRNAPGYILTTIDGNKPDYYSCEIKVRGNGATQNLLVTVTDERLLKATGGIVQGMSGSPIIQNGKLIGAVTHVLVDDPSRGYGIYAETMLETAKSASTLKNAS